MFGAAAVKKIYTMVAGCVLQELEVVKQMQTVQIMP